MEHIFEHKKRTISYLCIGIVIKNFMEFLFTDGLPIIEMGAAVLCYQSTKNLKKTFALPMLIYDYLAFILMTISLLFMNPKQVAYEVTNGTISNSTTVITYNNVPIQDYILMYWCFYAVILCNVQTYYSDLSEARIEELTTGVTKGGESLDIKTITGTV